MAKKTVHDKAGDALSRLRKEAEKAISKVGGIPTPEFSSMEVSDLLHNIQVQQIELEMQNDELRISNEQLELQRAKFAGLFDLAPVGYFILNHFGIIEEVNAIGLQMLNVTKNLVINRRFQNFVYLNETEIFSSFLQSLRFSDYKHSCQITLQTYGGDTFHAQLEGISTPKNPGENIRFYIALFDITERTNAALKLSNANERLNIALSSSAAGTWEINLKTGEIFLDNFSRDIFGFQDEQFDGRSETFLSAIYPDDRKMVEEKLQEALSLEKELDIEYRVICQAYKICYVAARGHVGYNEQTETRNFVGILIDISQKKQLEHEADELRLSQQKNIMAATLQAQENERKRISETLHDSVSQLLYGIKLNLQNQHPENDQLKKVNQLIELSIQETRNIAFELAPSVLTDFGLAITIEEMCKRLSTATLSIKATLAGLMQRLDPAMEISIFRIVQELVNNSIKHAQATVINITLLKKNNHIAIEVIDDGKGFIYIETHRTYTGSGLSSIKNRLSVYNGTLDIDTMPGKGTKVLIGLKE
ncbi:PAS domain-containing protein [Mucilaginibacter paludis]|uniref:Signal transduction histidine kinase n=1 Tax=Mucilaginibacter paludis DSM 18603 TaxID=714943 RepID=H1Y2D9_9SPHI|nr:PAS domain-containing protein [Mucilaginibacter paludis]EHQ27919.1 putative signal transduction histidine kinase [Mucilaginibacter paludis DSM 18603]